MFTPQDMMAGLTALAVFATIIAVVMPLLARDTLGPRMKSVALERDALRARERARLNADQKGSPGLRKQNAEAKGLVKSVVDGLNLKEALSDEGTRTTLMHAGLRAPRHLSTFLAARVGLPLVFGGLAALYIFVLGGLDQTFQVKLLACFGAAFAGFYLPNVLVKNMVGKRQLSITRAWPDALDLTLICVESGMSIEAAFRRVSEEIGKQSIELAEELVMTVAELSYLQDRRTAYENLFNRTGLEAVKAVTLTLIQAERYGTPLSQALKVLAQENRDKRMNAAEKKAHALPPKMTVPMILFFLPVLFCVILTPAYITVKENWPS